ncbi:MAG: holo-ACP synthase [Anaerolineales bacterium]
MISGLGVDLVDESRFDPKHASRPFLERVFTESELDECAGDVNAAARLAGKFAAKEAFSKALGSGMRDGLGFMQIEVLHDGAGAPKLMTTGEAERQVVLRGVTQIHVTITHSAGLAVAVVILETED